MSLELDDAAAAVADQLDAIESENRARWFEADAERRRAEKLELDLRAIEIEIPRCQLRVLRSRKDGDIVEAARIEAQVEVNSLSERHEYLERLHALLSESTIASRVEASRGHEDNQRFIYTLAQFRESLTGKIQKGLSAKVAVAKQALEESKHALTNTQGKIEDAKKVKSDLVLNCETYDQALESILRETKDEYKKLNKANATIAALEKELEIASRRTEGLNRQCRSEENAAAALKKQLGSGLKSAASF